MKRNQFRKYMALLGPNFFIFAFIILKHEILKYIKFEICLLLSKCANFGLSH
jgi:hypothetical protein